jgi:hypothetical protein
MQLLYISALLETWMWCSVGGGMGACLAVVSGTGKYGGFDQLGDSP